MELNILKELSLKGPLAICQRTFIILSNFHSLFLCFVKTVR